MAKVVTVELEAKTDKAISEIEELRKEVEKLNKEVVSSNKKTEDGLKNIESTGKGAAKSLKAIGTTIKAIGIGLLIQALGVVKDLFSSNQKVVDLFNTAFEFLSIAFNDFVSFITDNFGVVGDFFTKIFEDPLQSVKDFAKAIKDNLIERFQSAIEVVGFLGSALKKLFTGDFKGAWEDAKNAGEEFLDVLTGVDDTLTKTQEAVNGVVEAVTSYTTNTYKAAKATVQLTKDVELLRIVNQGLVEEYDRQAEKLRQVRDDETLSIQDRIKANKELGDVLDKQQKEMLKNADQQLKLANINFAKDKENQEARIALQEAINEKKAIEAQITGFQSEQIINRIALEKEAQELGIAVTDAENERRLNQLAFDAEMEETELGKLEKMRMNLIEESLIEEERLQKKVDLYKQGTQARIDAENELLAFQQANSNAQIKIDKDVAKSKITTVKTALGGIAALVGENSKFGKAIAISQAIQDTYAGANKALAQGGIFGIAAAIGITAAGLANVRNIASTQEPSMPSFATGGGGGQSAPSASAASIPPAFNVVGASSTSQLSDVINSSNDKPVKAYVVSGDVTTAQEMDRNIIQQSGI